MAKIIKQKYTLNYIESIVNQILADKNLFFGDNFRVQIGAVLEQEGFLVMFQDLGFTINGYMVCSENYSSRIGKNRIIVVNTADPEKVQRLTVARELGRYCLKKSAGKVFKNYKHITDNVYSENDNDYSYFRFARELLMPKEKFMKKLKELSGQRAVFAKDIAEQLSDIFGVPEGAVYKRFSDLELYIGLV